MKRILAIAPLGFLFFTVFFTACKKDNNQSQSSERKQIVTGDWKQTDIVLGVPVTVKVGGNKYSWPAGTSVLTDPYLNAFGVSSFFVPTVDNVYHFTSAGAYKIDGATDLILPVAGGAGNWSLDVYDAVLKLTTADNKNDPHWINGITSDSLALSLTVDIPGMGTAPLTLLLKKQ